RPVDAPLLLLARDRFRLALAGTGIGVGPLTAHRQSLAVAQAAIAGQIHQPLDVDRGLATQVTLNRVVGVDGLADLQDFLIRQVLHPALTRDAELVGDLDRLGPADAVDVGQRDDNALVGGDVHPRDTCHVDFSPAPRAGWLAGPSQRVNPRGNAHTRRANGFAAGMTVVSGSARSRGASRRCQAAQDWSLSALGGTSPLPRSASQQQYYVGGRAGE